MTTLEFLQQFKGDAAIPPELVNAMLIADAEKEAANENHQRLKTYLDALSNFAFNVSNRPDLPHTAPERPHKVVFAGMKPKTEAHGGGTATFEMLYEESDELLGPAVVNYVPPSAPPAGVVKIGPIRIVNRSNGKAYYGALVGDTVADGAEIVHPQTGELLRKVLSPFGGLYEVQ